MMHPAFSRCFGEEGTSASQSLADAMNTETHWACSCFMFRFERAKGLMLGRPMLKD